MSRDEFANSTKEQLARRAGYRCSFPECGVPAFGPSQEGSNRTTNVGTACHIAAASGGPGARRFVSTMTPRERMHIDNGIWMCRTHGKLIDDDETRFTIAILKRWKEIAEEVARIMMEKNCDYNKAIQLSKFNELAPESIRINIGGAENEIIGNFINDCCIGIAWGRSIGLKIRDFMIEHVRNAFQHGMADEVTISASDNKVIITDNGSQFNPKSLVSRNLNSGGTLAVKEIFKETNSGIILTPQRINDINILAIGKISHLQDIQTLTPCTHYITFQEFVTGDIEFSIQESCTELYVILPNYISPSDIGLLNRTLFEAEKISKPITLITRYLSDLVSSLIRQNNPNISIIEV